MSVVLLTRNLWETPAKWSYECHRELYTMVIDDAYHNLIADAGYCWLELLVCDGGTQ